MNAHAIETLRQALRTSSERNGLVSFRAAVSITRPLHWLAGLEGGPLFYYLDRFRREEIATCGQFAHVRVDDVCSMAEVRRLLDDASYMTVAGRRLYGGMRFDPTVTAQGGWQAFGAVYFFLPRLEIRRIGASCELWVHADAGSDADLADALRALDGLQLEEVAPSGDAGVDIATRIDLPGYSQWQSAVSDLLARIESGEVEKTVLARASRFVTGDRLDALALFDQVRASAPHCYHIYFEPEPGIAFLSLTPERLFRRTGDRLVSEAVAGTRPRGLAAVDDARFRDELLSSDKDRREHAFVGRSIIEALEPMCTRVELDLTPTEMRLRGNRHLKSVVRATLQNDVTSGRVLEAIHPTPAVGGCPTSTSLSLIDQIEPFDRGWYAGAVGWIGEDEAELTVGIRSALVEPGALTLYAGAGIVQGSEPDAEWSEIENKIDTFLNVIATRPTCEETTIRG
jgi:menaquinone-specific isochorismate synthase